MDFSQEEIYALVGREDKAANLTFKVESEAYRLYGLTLTVVFLYSQRERENLDQRLLDPNNKSTGKVKAKNLLSGLPEERIKQLANEGINTEDIADMLYFRAPGQNTFHSAEKRSITKITVPIYTQPKGRDYDWMYGFAKKLVKEGRGLSPKERVFYLACKLYYEPGEVTADEKNEIFQGSANIDPEIEWEYLQLKYQRQELTEPDIERLATLLLVRSNTHKKLLNEYLLEAGSSLKRLEKEDPELAKQLLQRVRGYREKTLNILGMKSIFLPVDRYLHVFMRHVEELKFTKQFDAKTNFQWVEDDVIMVLEKVIESIHDEIQKFFEENSGRRYSRYGKKAVYFEGDYYELHIEANGAVSTFYKVRKKQEQEAEPKA